MAPNKGLVTFGDTRPQGVDGQAAKPGQRELNCNAKLVVHRMKHLRSSVGISVMSGSVHVPSPQGCFFGLLFGARLLRR